jgi:hypothetical protein
MEESAGAHKENAFRLAKCLDSRLTKGPGSTAAVSGTTRQAVRCPRRGVGWLMACVLGNLACMGMPSPFKPINEAGRIILLDVVNQRNGNPGALSPDSLRKETFELFESPRVPLVTSKLSLG